MNLKRFSGLLALIIVSASCKKNSDSTVSFTPVFYFVNGGEGAIGNNIILFSSSDTAVFNLVVSSTYTTSTNTTVTLSVSDAYRTAYNTAHSTSYNVMPSGAYSFEGSFVAGTDKIYDTIPVTVYRHLLSSGSYMLPVEITAVSNYGINTSYSVAYLHIESNLLSGIYSSTGIKYSYTGNASDSVLNSTDSFSLSKSLVPVSAITSQIDYADVGVNGWKYLFAYSEDGGGFNVTPNSAIQNSIQAGSFKVLSSSFDTSSHDIYIKTSYKNQSGDERIIEESLKLK